MTHLSVLEWGRVRVANHPNQASPRSFTRPQANALISAARAHPLGGNEGGAVLRDHYTHLAAQQMVGILATEGCSLEILPKIETEQGTNNDAIRRRLISMLDVALGLRISDGIRTDLAKQNDTLLEFLIRHFADQLFEQVRKGLPHSYLAREADLPHLKGSLNAVRQFSINAVRPDRLSSRYDTLSQDTALMQAVKAGVVFVRRFARERGTIKRLDELRLLLSDVSDVPARDIPWSRVTIDRTSKSWESIYNLVRLFLKRDWQSTHRAKTNATGLSLLFPMNDLFESYIAAEMSRALRGTEFSVKSQGGRLFCLVEEGEGGRSRFQTRPDLLITRGDKTIAIVDTKWKRLSTITDDPKRGVSQADIYQMMAYGRLYLCPNLILVYPYHSALSPNEPSMKFKIQNSKDRLSIATVNLAQDRHVLRKRLLELTDVSG